MSRLWNCGNSTRSTFLLLHPRPQYSLIWKVQVVDDNTTGSKGNERKRNMCSGTGTTRKVTGILFFLCLLLVFCPSVFAREEHFKNVLVLNSYHSGFT
ncbi:MAG: hypothetical protein K8S14_06330, partial [Actinomycetia bacterium]|nr:hypothetical protein [Actinomycetes bacterium]